MIQQDLFGNDAINQQNPLTNRRVGFIGTFKNPSRAALIRKVKAYGATKESKEGLTRDTQILVIGSDVKQETLNRLTCYEHDGWKPLKISETELLEIFNGHYSGYETPPVLTKQISIDMSYYNWIPPVYKEDDDAEEEKVRIKRNAFVVLPLLSMERVIQFQEWRFMSQTGPIQTWELFGNSLATSEVLQMQNTLMKPML